MRIFLDVGANRGQTLAAVLDPSLKFDWIVCFEPVKDCWDQLYAMADRRVLIMQCGLWTRNCEKLIFEPKGKGGSMWRKDNHRADATSQMCKFIRASPWFKANIDDGDIVFLKLNVEGAECDILDDLLDSGEFRKVSFAMVDFDVRKIESQKHREAELRARLAEFPFPRVAYTKAVMKGPTHQDRIKNWIRTVEGVR